MSKTATVSLGGQDYIVHPFNLDELQDVGGLLAKGTNSGVTSIAILKIALRRAEPKIDDVGKVEIASFGEVQKATEVILELAGIERVPPAAAPPAAS